jgi:hypothetical protein
VRGLVVSGGGGRERGVIAVVDEGDEEGRDEEGHGDRDGNDVAVRVGGVGGGGGRGGQRCWLGRWRGHLCWS